jgi:TRAP transporter TAXI family solute receptor
MRRLLMFGSIGIFVFGISAAWAQKTVHLSIASGGTGAVYYPYCGGMGSIISKYIPYADATVEVTNASVDNCRLLAMKKVDLALCMADTAWDASNGTAPFKEKIPLRTLAVLYPNFMQIVTLQGKGIEKFSDLKGKRVATGAPGSGTEVMSLRVIQAFGLDPDKDMKRDRLNAGEAAGALKDGKIDAIFWGGGAPTAALTDLGATPGMKIKFINSADVVPKMREKYGPLYVKWILPAKTYPGQNVDVPITAVWNLAIATENLKENVAYDIVKTMFEHKQELVASHSAAQDLSLEPQASGGSPIPFHPGAIRYFKEKGIIIK